MCGGCPNDVTIVRTGKLTLGRQKITLSSERPIQECVLKGDRLEMDAQQDTQLSSFMVQGKHTLHYPMNRGPFNSRKPEEIVRELGLVEVFGYKDQSVSNCSEVHLEQAENCPIYNHQVCSQGNTENTAPIYSPEVVYPQNYLDQAQQETRGSEDRNSHSKDGYSSMRKTYLPTSEEEHPNIQGDIGRPIEPEIGQISNIQKEDRETSDVGESDVYGVGPEIPLCMPDSVLTQLVKDELEEEWQKNRASERSELYSLDTPKVYTLNSPTKAHPLEREGWVTQYIYQMWRQHRLYPQRVSNKNRHLSPPNPNVYTNSKGMLYDCKHCENSCICVAYKTTEGVIVPDCDCRIENGMCINSLKYAILKSARLALERHEHGHCSLNCLDQKGCVREFMQKLAQGMGHQYVKPRCGRKPACSQNGHHKLHPSEIDKILQSNNFSLLPQTRNIFQIANKQFETSKEQVKINSISMFSREKLTNSMGIIRSHVLGDDSQIDIQCGGLTLRALIDTGACGSVLSCETFRELDLVRLNAQVSDTAVHCIMANGARQKAFCDVTLPLSIDGKEYTALFHVLEGLASQVILGRSFLQEFNMVLDFSDSTAPKRTVPVRLENGVTIPPKSEVCTAARVPNELDIWDEQEGTFERTYSLDHYKCKTNSMAWVKIHDGLIPICIINTSSTTKTLRKGISVGTYTNSLLGIHHIKYLDNNTDTENGEILTAENECDGTDSEDMEMDMGQTNTNSTDPEGFHIDLSESIFTEKEKEICQEMLREHKLAFSDRGILGCTQLVEHKIELLPGARPPQARAFHMAPPKRRELDKIIKEQLDQGILEPAEESAWTSPAFLVPKKTKPGEPPKYRLVIDFRELNKATIKKTIVIPRIESVCESAGEFRPKYFSCLDIAKAFYQIPIAQDSKKFTSFLVNSTHAAGPLNYSRMPMGLSQSPSSFQSLIDLVLSGIKYQYVLAYMDDIIIWSQSFQEHMDHLAEVLKRMIDSGLKLGASKCLIGREKVQFLGHILTTEGIYPTPENIEKLSELPRPTTVKQTRRLLGLAGFYRRFCPSYGVIAQPLYEITKKKYVDKFMWGPAQEKAFRTIKELLTSDNLLLYPRFDQKFILATDSSEYGMGACLSQYDESGDLRPVAFWATPFKGAQKNYSTGDKEMAAIYFAVRHFKVYLEGAKFEILTDHKPLIARITRKSLDASPRMLRWLDNLQRYQFTIRYIPGSKNITPDFLSRLFVPPEKDRTPYHIPQVCDNWEAEGENSQAEVTTDQGQKSQVKPINIKEVATSRDPINPDPGESGCIQSVDNEARVEGNPIIYTREVAIKKGPNHKKRNKHGNEAEKLSQNVIEMVSIKPEDIRISQGKDPECRNIIEFLQTAVLPEDPKMARAVLLREEDYILIDNILFRLSSTMGKIPTLEVRLVVPKDLRLHFLQQNHDVSHAGHMGMHKMIGKMRPKLFWFGMNTDIKNYCESCQICCETKRSTRPIKPPLTLRSPSPRPFYSVNMDFLERLPVTERGNKHIVCLVDYYSRYLICWPQKDLTAETLVKGFADNVIYKHGAVHTIVSDNGSAFISDAFKTFCAQYGISHSFISSLHPMASGLVERFNRSILNIIRAYINNHQSNWDELLTPLSFALNTSNASVTGISPYLLLHGFEPIFPETNRIPDMSEKGQTVSNQFANHLQQQHEAHQYASKMMAEKSKQMKERYDKQVWEPTLNPGDIVYVYTPRIQDHTLKLKLAKIYHGPFVIIRFHTDTTVYLKDIKSGKYIAKPVAIARLKKAGTKDLRQEEPSGDIGEPLDIGDIPLDSFELPHTGKLNGNKSGSFVKGTGTVGDDNSQVERVTGTHDSGLCEQVHNETSTPTPGESPVSVPSKLLTEPSNKIKTRRLPMSYFQIGGEKSETLKEMKTVEDFAHLNGERHVKVKFKDNSLMWIPIAYLNEFAKKRFIQEDITYRELPNLRQRRK